jgi:hypothetical protein
LQVTVLEQVVPRQAGPVRLNPPAGDRAARDERGRACAVVGAEEPIRADGTAELRHHNHDRVVPQVAHPRLQRDHAAVEVGQRRS